MAYLPPNSITLDKAKPQQIRLGLQGYPGTGKTWSSLTFPNPIVLDIDRGLGAHLGRNDVVQVPFYDPEFVKTIIPTQGYNIRDALTYWIDKEGRKLEADQTLILDGISGIESNYHFMWRKQPTLTKTGVIDDRDEWTKKITYFGELTDLLISLRCHVVVITHEAETKTKDNVYDSMKVRPLLTGQAGNRLLSKFTDWFRQHASDKPTPGVAVAEDKLAQWGMNAAEFAAMCKEFPRNTVYYWQTEGDAAFDGKASSLVNFPRYIPANYKNFVKWMKK